MAQNQAIERAVQAFLLDREVRGLTPATVLWYRRYTSAFVRWLADHEVTSLDGITLPLLREYIAELHRQGLGAKTLLHHVIGAKVFCKWCHEEGLLPDNPAERLPNPKVPKKVLPALSKDEVSKLLQACDCERDKALLLFMLDTGVRCSELVAMNVGDVNLQTGSVLVTHGKGQRERTVFLGAQSRKALLRWLLERGSTSDGEPLWTSQNTGERLTTWGVNILLRRLGERAGVHCHPHKLRRTFAVWSLRAGMDLARLAALLGHSDLHTVRQYLALVDDDLQTAHREHGPVDALLSKKGGKR